MKRKYGWIGHTLGKPAANITRQVLDWNLQGKRKIGRPKKIWQKSTEVEAMATRMTWAELKEDQPEPSTLEECWLLQPYAPKDARGKTNYLFETNFYKLS